MSFGYLPLPLYLIMLTFVSGYLFIYAVKGWRKEPKTFIIGFFLLALSAIGGGVIRLSNELKIFNESLSLIRSSTIWVGVVGTALTMYGCWQKAKDDQHKRRAILIINSILIVIALIAVALEMYIYFKR